MGLKLFLLQSKEDLSKTLINVIFVLKFITKLSFPSGEFEWITGLLIQTVAHFISTTVDYFFACILMGSPTFTVSQSIKLRKQITNLDIDFLFRPHHPITGDHEGDISCT